MMWNRDCRFIPVVDAAGALRGVLEIVSTLAAICVHRGFTPVVS